MSNQSWIEAISEMLRDDLKVTSGILSEDDDGSRCKAVTIKAPGKSLYISLNAKVAFKTNTAPICIKDRLFPLFQESKGIARICDYWILAEQITKNGPVLYVLLCELKSGTTGDIAQLENAKLLAEYVIAMVAYHRKLPHSRVEYRGLIFAPDVKSPKSSLRIKAATYTPQGRLGLPIMFLPDKFSYQLAWLCG